MSSSLLHCKVCPSHKDNSNFPIWEIFFFFCVSKRLLKHSFQEKKSHLFWELSQKKIHNKTPTHKKNPTKPQKPTQQTIWHPYFRGYNLKKDYHLTYSMLLPVTLWLMWESEWTEKISKWDIYLPSCGPSTKIYSGTLFSWICHTSESLSWFSLMLHTMNPLWSLDSYTRIAVCIWVLREKSSTDRYGQELW